MTTAELPHEVTLRRSLPLRLFMLVWREPPANTCLLFWGYLFLIPAALLCLVFLPLVLLGRLIGEIFTPWLDSRPARPVHVKLASPKTGPTPLERISSRMGAIWFRISTIFGAVWNKVAIPLAYIGSILGAIGAVVLAYLGIKALLATALTDILIALLWAVLFVVAVFVVVVAMKLVGNLLQWVFKPSGAFRMTLRSIHEHTCARVIVKD